mmetsp:Transcript_9682/g.58525  ORF Transcript_9682/g.58525 Transcript_9682/m.58525 type:complete len:438 (-) Transcript_9682:734-2047(-)
MHLLLGVIGILPFTMQQSVQRVFPTFGFEACFSTVCGGSSIGHHPSIHRRHEPAWTCVFDDARSRLESACEELSQGAILFHGKLCFVQVGLESSCPNAVDPFSSERRHGNGCGASKGARGGPLREHSIQGHVLHLFCRGRHLQERVGGCADADARPCDDHGRAPLSFRPLFLRAVPAVVRSMHVRRRREPPGGCGRSSKQRERSHGARRRSQVHVVGHVHTRRFSSASARRLVRRRRRLVCVKRGRRTWWQVPFGGTRRTRTGRWTRNAREEVLDEAEDVYVRRTLERPGRGTTAWCGCVLRRTYVASSSSDPLGCASTSATTLPRAHVCVHRVHDASRARLGHVHPFGEKTLACERGLRVPFPPPPFEKKLPVPFEGRDRSRWDARRMFSIELIRDRATCPGGGEDGRTDRRVGGEGMASNVDVERKHRVQWCGGT